MHQYPAYTDGCKAAGARVPRNILAWDLQQHLGVKSWSSTVRTARTRGYPGMPEDLLGLLVETAEGDHRCKARRAWAIPVDAATPRVLAGVNKLTRAGKSHDNDPEIRHRRWRGEVDEFRTEREALIASRHRAMPGEIIPSANTSVN